MARRVRPVPADSVVTSGFGPRWGTVHRGTDFGRNGGSAGMAVYAAQGGTVTHAGAASGFGGPAPAGWVVIDHPTADGSGTTVYGHVIAEVRVGQRVEAGNRIARVNPSQATNGGVAPHLHFEVHPTVWRAGSQIDPIPWLAGASSPGGGTTSNPSNPAQDNGPTQYGVDVSEHQDGMSLTQAAKEGFTFAIIRTTDGTYRDRTYRSHVDDARRGGMVLAAYHYLRNPSEGTTVAQQVQASVDVMGPNHRLPVWIDVETPAGIHVDHIRQCKREYERHGIRVIGAYSYVPYWENQIKPGEPDSHEFGAFWVAAYGANRVGYASVLYPGNRHKQWDYPLGNQRPVVWQFGSRGKVAGREVDVNAFRGTRAQLEALFNGEPVVKDPEPAPTPEPAPEDGWRPPPSPRPEPAPEEDPGTTEEPPVWTPPTPPKTLMDLVVNLIVSLIVGRGPRTRR